MINSLVLLSGGMDSATALAQSARHADKVIALSINYGQRHAVELKHASLIAAHYGADHEVLDLSGWGRLLTGSALTDPNVAVPHGHYAEESMRATIVPNRNATMLMAAVGVAEALGCRFVITAVHAGDHAVYPDCRPEFIESASRTALLGTDGKVEIVAPFIYVSKTKIAGIGSVLGVPYGLTWSCYEGGDLHCGKCGTCTERKEAFADSGVLDPTAYAAA